MLKTAYRCAIKTQNSRASQWLISSSRLYSTKVQCIQESTLGNVHGSQTTLAFNGVQQLNLSFTNKKEFSELHPYWIKAAQCFKRELAVSLSSQLDFRNAFGYLGLSKSLRAEMGVFLRKASKGGVFSDILPWKQKNPLHIHLIRIGEFYEACGIDALLLIEHCGLNPMGRRLQAGFPCKNIQDILDELTSKGFSISIFEELKDNDAGRSKLFSAPRRIRVLSQVVSPMAPIYLHKLLLKEGSISFRTSRPVIGISHQVRQGYQLIEIDLQLRTIQITDQLTMEALMTQLFLAAPAYPIFFLATPFDDCKTSSGGPRFRHILQNLTPYQCSSWPPLKTSILLKAESSEFLEKLLAVISERERLNMSAFEIRKNNCEENATETSMKVICGPRTLSPQVASALGLRDNPAVPDLVRFLLPTSAPLYTAHLLRRWLQSPPPYHVANVFQSLCRTLSKEPLPLLDKFVNVRAVSLHKIAALLKCRQCNAVAFIDIVSNLEAVKTLLEDHQKSSTSKFTSLSPSSTITDLLWPLLEYQNHMRAIPSKTEFLDQVNSIIFDIERCIVMDKNGAKSDIPHNLKVYRLINSLFAKKPQQNSIVGRGDVEASTHHQHQSVTEELLTSSNAPSSVTDSDYVEESWDEVFSELIFFERLERKFRHRINRSYSEIVARSYKRVESSVQNLLQVILRELSFPISIQELLNDESQAIQRFEKIAMKSPLRYDLLHNSISINPKFKQSYMSNPSSSAQEYPEFVTINHHRKKREVKGDEHGHSRSSSITTEGLNEALIDYLDAVSTAELTIESTLKELNVMMEPKLSVISLSAHFIVLLQTAYFHTVFAVNQGWTLPNLEPLLKLPRESHDGTILPSMPPLVMNDLSPYWLPRPKSSEALSLPLSNSPQGTSKHLPVNAAPSDFFATTEELEGPFTSTFPSISSLADLTLNGIILLTAPNMSGKSTLIRSTLAVALLGNCGFFVPCSYASIPRFDGYFIREGGCDVPAEGRSHFAVEMGDTQAILRDSTERSLILFDELGRGTSGEDGVSIAGAVLEELDRRGSLGIFSTHFHQLFDLNLNLDNVTEMFIFCGRKQEEERYNNGSPNSQPCANLPSISTNTIQKDATNLHVYSQSKLNVLPGRCLDSLGIVTAREAGIPDHVIKRAQILKNGRKKS